MTKEEEKKDLGSLGEPLPNNLPEGIGSIIVKSLFIGIGVRHLSPSLLFFSCLLQAVSLAACF